MNRPATQARVAIVVDSLFRSWLFLTVFMAPILAVLIVSGWGFVVWMWQVFVAGPPTY